MTTTKSGGHVTDTTIAPAHPLAEPEVIEGEVLASRPRLRGLRFPALPSGPLLAQLAGAGGLLTGVYLQWGMAIALVVGGVGAAVLGALREAGKV